jgi:RNA polymerase sigma-70 factor (ECF subfamily)
MNDADATLVQRALAGESSAFDELVQRHRPRLVRFIALLIWDADEAETLAQEALTRAFARLSDYSPELPLGSWLRGIALNLGRNYLRDRSRHAKAVAPEQLSDVPSPDGRRHGVLSGILRREMGEQTEKAIGLLPIPLREAFVLHFVEGLDYREISQLTGVTVGTARVRAHRARTLLRASLGPVVDTWMRGEPEPF